jgi:ppGpp synthetase/RelA/SpoT-type nucleotidyltranferase
LGKQEKSYIFAKNYYTMATLEEIKDCILNDLSRRMTQSGIMFRIFGRAKSVRSLEHKMQIKGDKYRAGAKIQDMIGVRIVLYFSEDVEAMEIFLCNDDLVDRSVDNLDVSTFRPQRLNLVKKIPEKYLEDFHAALPKEYAPYLDDTYEIQIRTVFSEGWHEVEHDLRYKCEEDWEGCDFFSRQLNGVIATLETAQWSMGAIFHEMAQKNLVNGNYHAMLRNKLLLRFADDDLSEPLKKYLDAHDDIARQLYQTDRLVFLMALLNHDAPIPLRYDNAVFLINRIDIMDEGVKELESEEFRKAFGQFVS